MGHCYDTKTAISEGETESLAHGGQASPAPVLKERQYEPANPNPKVSQVRSVVSQ